MDSNAVKFTHEGKVGVKLSVVPEPECIKADECHKKSITDQLTNGSTRLTDSPTSESCSNENGIQTEQARKDPDESGLLNDNNKSPDEEHKHSSGLTVWIRCDVYDSGIGIPGIIYVRFVRVFSCYCNC